MLHSKERTPWTTSPLIVHTYNKQIRPRSTSRNENSRSTLSGPLHRRPCIPRHRVWPGISRYKNSRTYIPKQWGPPELTSRREQSFRHKTFRSTGPRPRHRQPWTRCQPLRPIMTFRHEDFRTVSPRSGPYSLKNEYKEHLDTKTPGAHVVDLVIGNPEHLDKKCDLLWYFNTPIGVAQICDHFEVRFSYNSFFSAIVTLMTRLFVIFARVYHPNL